MYSMVDWLKVFLNSLFSFRAFSRQASDSLAMVSSNISFLLAACRRWQFGSMQQVSTGFHTMGGERSERIIVRVYIAGHLQNIRVQSAVGVVGIF